MIITVPFNLQNEFNAATEAEIRDLYSDVRVMRMSNTSEQVLLEKIVKVGWSSEFAQWMYNVVETSEGESITYAMAQAPVSKSEIAELSRDPEGAWWTGFYWLGGGILASIISYSIAAPGHIYIAFSGAVLYGLKKLFFSGPSL